MPHLSYFYAASKAKAASLDEMSQLNESCHPMHMLEQAKHPSILGAISQALKSISFICKLPCLQQSASSNVASAMLPRQAASLALGILFPLRVPPINSPIHIASLMLIFYRHLVCHSYK